MPCSVETLNYVRCYGSFFFIRQKIGYQGVYNNSFAPGQPAELDLLCVKVVSVYQALWLCLC